MRIAQLAPLIETVPPRTYGGIELVVSLLTEELLKRGHEVTLFASGDSTTAGRLVSVTPTSLRTESGVNRHLWPAYEMQLLMELESRQNEFDIVHNHMGWQAFGVLSQLELPVVTTNHNLIESAVAPIYRRFSDLPFVAISEAYLRGNMPEELNYCAVIYNGIDVQRYDFDNESERKYLCFLGRLCNDKGTVEAIAIARRLGLPLRMAGKVDEVDRAYFDLQVASEIDDVGVQYIGEVDHFGKVELFRHALALLYPINFPEPFGLVMAEALACGVPVLAVDRGAVREVLSEDTAVVSDSWEALAGRFSESQAISRQACRSRAERLFGVGRMVDCYEEVYELAVAGRLENSGLVTV